MTLMEAVRQDELSAANEAVRFDSAALVANLRELLGAQLVAYIGGVNETRAVREWAEGAREPRPEALQRLRTAYRAASVIRKHESLRTVHAWFQGLNPMLEDRSPARLLREGDIESDASAVLAAARSFAATA